MGSKSSRRATTRGTGVCSARVNLCASSVLKGDHDVVAIVAKNSRRFLEILFCAVTARPTGRRSLRRRWRIRSPAARLWAQRGWTGSRPVLAGASHAELWRAAVPRFRGVAAAHRDAASPAGERRGSGFFPRAPPLMGVRHDSGWNPRGSSSKSVEVAAAVGRAAGIGIQARCARYKHDTQASEFSDTLACASCLYRDKHSAAARLTPSESTTTRSFDFTQN